jgi:hypothetical protein
MTISHRPIDVRLIEKDEDVPEEDLEDDFYDEEEEEDFGGIGWDEQITSDH